MQEIAFSGLRLGCVLMYSSDQCCCCMPLMSVTYKGVLADMDATHKGVLAHMDVTHKGVRADMDV